MVLAIALACGISAGLAARRWRGPLLGVGSAVLAALAAAWALGFFSVKGSEAGGYGSFGMNLNALWNPVSLDWNWWVPGQGQLCWSRVLPVRPLVGNSLEAFNYLGLGLLAAGAACDAALLGALALKRLAPRRLWRFAKRHLPLAAVCALLTAFAVSNVVTANSRTLLELPLPGPLLALCDVFRASGRMFWPVWYLLALAAWLVLGAAHFGSDALAKAQGRLAEETMAVTDWQLVGLTQNADGTLTTVDGDPQMIWENGEGAVLRTVRMEAAFDRSPREMCLYYTTKEGEPFSVNKRVFAAQADDGSYLYTLPQGRIAALRLDPCSPEENKPVEMTIAGLYVNEPAPWWSYFAPGWAGVFSMVLYPGLAAAAISLVRAAWMWYKNKRSARGAQG